MDSSEREDLDQLVKSPGWLRFLQHVEQEWGTREKGGGARFTAGARQAADQNTDNDALMKLRQVCIAQREIHNVMSWADGRLKDVVKHETEFATIGAKDWSRRGGL